LRRVAAVFRETARLSTDVVGCYGGEEFCVVLAETDAQSGREFAERIRAAAQALGLPQELNPAGCVTASFRVASMDFFDGQPADLELGKSLVAKATSPCILPKRPAGIPFAEIDACETAATMRRKSHSNESGVPTCSSSAPPTRQNY
jgi:hypothetical protein